MIKLFFTGFILMVFISCNASSEQNTQTMTKENQQFEYATLGGGCFWCIEAIFEELKGVESAISGYSGGSVKNPSYREVTSGRTGHAEVVQIQYDPDQISYKQILEVFFHLHDPTTLNRQGADVGTQYRSVIFYQNEQQEKIAKEVFDLIDNSDLWKDPLVTEIKPLEEFYVAEDYHQDYFDNNPNQPYCAFVIGPKLNKLKDLFKEKLKE